MIGSLITGMVGGFIAWVATTIIGQPLIRFLNLRSQAAVLLDRYDPDHFSGEGEPFAPDDFGDEWKNTRREELAECGTDLVAFDAANANLVFLLHKLPKTWRCSPKSAGLSFQTLSGLNASGGYYEIETRRQIINALKLNYPS